MKIAVIGSGISGLGAAYYLQKKHEVTVFEKNNYPGGHVNTIEVETADGIQPVDTGFIVHNRVTYPHLLHLFDELNVATEDSDMSFAVHNLDSNLQLSGSGLSGLLAQRKNIFRPSYWRFIKDILRFIKEARADLNTAKVDCTMGEYLERGRYGRLLTYNFILPMGSAVWSTPVDSMLEFPARTLIQFFYNHGILGVDTQFTWRVVSGGSYRYVKQLIDRSDFTLHLNAAVDSVEKNEQGVTLRVNGASLNFDRVIMASHAPASLKMLRQPSAAEEKFLSAFQYLPNKALLHTDESVMPPIRKIWSAWNYRIRGEQSSTVYWMNRLQNIGGPRQYFVSINEFGSVNPGKIIREIDYEHPYFDTAAVNAQKDYEMINRNGPVYFAGAYTRYGFHEDGLMSGIAAARQIDSTVLPSQFAENNIKMPGDE